MKKKFLVWFILLVFFPFTQLYALTWHTANQTTIAWDAVAVDSGSVEYEVFIANASTDPNKANPVSVWRGPETQTVITLSTEGQYYAGVKTWRIVDASTELDSVIGWSDDPNIAGDIDGDGVGDPFGIRFYVPPGVIRNLKPVSGA
jgi:hypothetical protein